MSENTKKHPKDGTIRFAVFAEADDCFNHYDNMEDAVLENPETNVGVFEVKYIYKGKFTHKHVIEKTGE